VSFGVMQAVSEQSKTTGIDRLVLLAYAFYAHKDTRMCWPANSKITKWVNTYDRKVRRAKQALIRTGELQLIKPGGNQFAFRKTDTFKVGLDTWTYPRQKDGNTPPLQANLFKENGQHHPAQKPARAKAKPQPQPDRETFRTYAMENGISDQDANSLYDIWDAAGWRNGFGKPIIIWKSTLIRRREYGHLPSQNRRKNAQPKQAFCDI